MKFFTADTHIDHEKAMGFPGRRGMTLPEWQAMILDKINSKVPRNGILYILGDFAFAPQKWREKIKCRDIWVIFGNHDHRNRTIKSFGQNKCRDTLDIKVCGARTFLSHYPHLVWPASHHGSFHLFGHCHNNRTKYWSRIPELLEMRSLDVCPESYKEIYGDFGVFDENEIYEILSKKKGHDSINWYLENCP